MSVIREAMERCKTEEYSQCEVKIIKKDGTKIPVILNYSAIKDENGEAINLLGTATDISELKRKEKELANEKAFSDQIIDGLADVLLVCDERLRIVKVNRAVEITGYGVNDFMGKFIGELPVMTADAKESAKAITERIASGEIVRNVEMPFTKKNGEKMVGSLSVSMLTDREENIVGGIMLIKRVLDSFKEVVSGLDDLSKATDRVRVLSREGVGNLEKIKEGMNEVASTSEEMAASSEETSAAIEEQTAAITQLSETISSVKDYADRTYNALVSNFKTE